MMKRTPFSLAYPVRMALLATVLGTGMAGAIAADADTRTSVAQERANCMSGNSNQDRATCLREAGAAKQESQRGNLRDSGNYGTNASQRCAALPADEKGDCERRSMGEGSVSGSVGSGGVVRELVTPVPASK